MTPGRDSTPEALKALRPPLLANAWLDAAVALAIASIAASMRVVFQHVDFQRTYHTGFEPYDLVILYGFAAAFGVARWVKRPKRGWLTALLVILAVGSMATVVWLEQNNVIVEYNRWIKRGMPETPF